MKRYNQICLSIALLGSTTYVDASEAVINAISVFQAVAAISSTPASQPTGGVPIAIVPPKAPSQSLLPVVVSQTAGLANFGTNTPVTLQYQVQQLPVTAEIDTLTMVASFGSTISSSSFTFDADTIIALNRNLVAGQAVIVQVGTTTVDENVVAYAGLLLESDMSKLFGYAVQAVPAGVTEQDLTSFTIDYLFVNATDTNTINVTANQSLLILNPTISVLSPLSGVSVQAVFGSSTQPVVSMPINLDIATVQAIQAALQSGDIVAFSVVAEYMYGLGEIVVTAYDVIKGVQLGNEAVLAITQTEEQAGNFIAYVVNLSMTGQSGQSAFVRGINQNLQLQVPAVASTAIDFYVPADLSVSIPQGQDFPNITLNGIFADGSSSAGFVFDAQDLQKISDAIASGDNVSVIVQQSSTGVALIASVYNITDFDQAVLATATNTVTPAQAKETLTGYALTYQLSGQQKATVLHAQLGQVVTFGMSVYFTLSIDPSAFSSKISHLSTNGVVMSPGGKITHELSFDDADFIKIKAALTAGHPIVIGTGYSAENQKMIMQAYDNVAKSVIAQIDQYSLSASNEPLFGFIVDYNPGLSGQARPTKKLIPGGNVVTLVPVTLTTPSGIPGSVVSCANLGRLNEILIQPDFGSSVASELIALSRHEVQSIQTVLLKGAIFTATYQNNYCVFSVWDAREQNMLIDPIAVPISGGTFKGFSVAYSYQNSDVLASTVSASAGQALTMLALDPLPLKTSVAKALTLPSATTQVSQLWFSPVFKNNEYAELSLGVDSGLMAVLNKVLQQGDEVVFVHALRPTDYSLVVPGQDLVLTAYNMSNPLAPEQLFSYVFPVVSMGGTPILQNNKWVGTNITYQFGNAPTVILPDVQPENPSFSISAEVNVVTALRGITSHMEKTFPDITAFYEKQAANAITYDYNTTLTAIDMTWGQKGVWAAYVDLNGALADFPEAQDNAEFLQQITSAQWSQGVMVLPILLSTGKCNTKSGFIMDASTIGGDCTATCYLVFASLDGQIIRTLPTVAKNSTDFDATSLVIELNKGYSNPQSIHLNYGQPVVLKLTGSPAIAS